MTKLAAMRGVGARMVVVILQVIISETYVAHEKMDLLHEEGVECSWTNTGPQSTAPSNDLGNACEDSGAKQPP